MKNRAECRESAHANTLRAPRAPEFTPEFTPEGR
jgi:hypothetical protein